MRNKLLVAAFLIAAGALVYAGRGLFEGSAIVTFALTFGGTTAAGVLGIALYRVQLELRASRHELARKQAELNFAREVQQALFPRQFPADGGLEFAGICVPASGISGDYYDVLQLDSGRLVFAIADISGKGISAAILMSNLQALLRTLAVEGHSPGALAARLNGLLHQVTEGVRFATLFYAEWNPEENRLRYINAGHNAPILLSASGSERLPAAGPPLGIFKEWKFQESHKCLVPGDTLVLFSDGVSEAGQEKDNEFGESRLEAIVAAGRDMPLEHIQEKVLAALRNWAGQELEDDMTLLLVRAGTAAVAREAGREALCKSV
ncbi:MAG TPA: PP2C family protein-serine/threonine phosphatase, partial [Terriglobia bacterium]|nr:PP2C family protein-serine/threonine phosphatase [Terriglobia bacterium]